MYDFDLQGYISQVENLEAVSQTVRATEDLYSTHPFNPIRIVALNRFWQSHTLCDLLGHSAATHSDQEVDSRIHELLQFMDPDAATIGNINSIACLVWGERWSQPVMATLIALRLRLLPNPLIPKS